MSKKVLKPVLKWRKVTFTIIFFNRLFTGIYKILQSWESRSSTDKQEEKQRVSLDVFHSFRKTKRQNIYR